MTEYRNENAILDEKAWHDFAEALNMLSESGVYRFAECDEVDSAFARLYNTVIGCVNERRLGKVDDEEKPRLRETVGTVTVDVKVDFAPMIDELEAMAQALRDIQARYGD